jgi:AraC-like DNA-binding protein
MFGFEPRSLRRSHAIVPSAQAAQRLTRLHAASVRLVRDAPEMLTHPEAMQGLQHSLIDALAGCLAGDDAPGATISQRNHTTIMRRFHKLVTDNPTKTLFLPDMCAAIGVSSRTLRSCCVAHLGIGPKHFLVLRRMNAARSALRAGATSVTEVATACGFWELGRFAVAYRALFGESPSATIGLRPPGVRQKHDADMPAANNPVHPWFGPQWAAAVRWAEGNGQPFGLAYIDRLNC